MDARPYGGYWSLCKTSRDDVGIVPYVGQFDFVGQGLAPAVRVGILPNENEQFSRNENGNIIPNSELIIVHFRVRGCPFV